jgi:hypothetical protein
MKPKHLFVIDTEQYAGNFERPLCAWCTGQVGECGVGQREADDFRATHPDMAEAFIGLVEQFDRDGRGCLRPVCLVDTPGWLNNGLGLNYQDTQEQRKMALDCFFRDMNAIDPNGVTPQVAALKEPLRYPAYLSVGIGFRRLPSDGILELMRQRAAIYADLNSLVITGFRLLG